MPADPSSFAEQIKYLQRAYLFEMLPEQFTPFREAVILVLKGRNDLPLLQKIYTTAHNIHGSAGTYGFSSISVCAHSIEELFSGNPYSDPEEFQNLADNFREKLSEYFKLLDAEILKYQVS